MRCFNWCTLTNTHHSLAHTHTRRERGERERRSEIADCEWKSQSLIGKVSASLHLPLEVPVAIEQSALWDARSGLRMRTGWYSLRNKLFITIFEQKKQHLWHSCCPISLVISNMKFNCKLSEQFWRIWCFPIQSNRSCTWMPERRFKDGHRVTGLVLKRLCQYFVEAPLAAITASSLFEYDATSLAHLFLDRFSHSPLQDLSSSIRLDGEHRFSDLSRVVQSGSRLGSGWATLRHSQSCPVATPLLYWLCA